ncbi:hypothetical protein [Enterococcus ratti]|uniref:Uncharacterized protein n=1 Tax=Enterococcus ratti TaxID=150033 RepID=A0A1L8WS38_9ENTE|nr:hypothetical protein [Enterococcus ratti]OJG83840.1 hypothetical protein RV14_GL000017 [Enterococcus ratti]
MITFVKALQNRPSIYDLRRNVTFSTNELSARIQGVIKESPTAFNLYLGLGTWTISQMVTFSGVVLFFILLAKFLL